MLASNAKEPNNEKALSIKKSKAAPSNVLERKNQLNFSELVEEILNERSDMRSPKSFER